MKYNPLREWLRKEVSTFIEEKRMNIKSFAEKAGVSYYTLYEFLRNKDHSLRDDDMVKILEALGYSLVPKKEELVYFVCKTSHVAECEDVYVLPVYQKIHRDGTPDISSRVGRVCSGTLGYAVEISDARAFPFHHRSVLVIYKQITEITGDGYYIFVDYSRTSNNSYVPLVREVRQRDGVLLFRLYNPEEHEVYIELEERGLKVVGRAIEFTVQVF